MRELIATKADSAHTHVPCTLQVINGLTNELANKAEQRGLQALGIVVQSLQAEVQRKADVQHGHPIAQITGLQVCVSVSVCMRVCVRV